MSDLDFSSAFGKRALERLQDEQVVWLTTVNAKGTPQPIPVWFLWQDDAFIIYSQPSTPKLRAIARSGNVSLNFNATEHGGDIVVFQGTAEIVADGPSAADVPAYVQKYAGGFESLSMTPEKFAEEYSEFIRVVPSRLRGW